jgi:hypothetical protein
MSIRAIIIMSIALACSGTSHKTPDAAVDALYSTCGHPGDLGNELGIGKFCTSFGDCAETAMAPLCSIIGDSSTHFCTKTCPMGSTNQCGTATMCVCNSGGQCGCTPTACLH